MKNNLKFKKWFEPFESVFRDLVNKNRDLTGSKNPFAWNMTYGKSTVIFNSEGIYEIEALLRSAMYFGPSIDESLLKRIFELPRTLARRNR